MPGSTNSWLVFFVNEDGAIITGKPSALIFSLNTGSLHLMPSLLMKTNSKIGLLVYLRCNSMRKNGVLLWNTLRIPSNSLTLLLRVLMGFPTLPTLSLKALRVFCSKLWMVSCLTNLWLLQRMSTRPFCVVYERSPFVLTLGWGTYMTLSIRALFLLSILIIDFWRQLLGGGFWSHSLQKQYH